MNAVEEQKLRKENEQLKEELSILRKNAEILSMTQSTNCLSQFLIDKMDAITFIKDVTNGLRYYNVNENFCITQHLTEQDIIGKDDYELFPSEIADKYRWDDETGQKEKIMEKAIKDEKEAHQMMRAIFHELPSAILIKDIEDDYRFYNINKKFEQMCNMSRELLIGKTDYEIFPKKEADKYRKDDMEAAAYTEDDPMLIHEIVTSPDRGVSTHLQTVKFSFTFKGKRLLVCVGNDVTLQHQMMDQLKEALSKAEQADKLKSQFIANMSHEIRTPLNSIIGFSQLIAKTESKEEQEEYNRIIAFNNNLLLTLFEDILNLSILDAGSMAFKETQFDFPNMFRDLTLLMSEKVSNPNVKFISENPLKELTVKIDRNRLIQIVTNLITNAAKFTQHGYIKMGYTCKDEGLEIYVEDTGMGIEEKNLSEIFIRFKKLNPFIQGTGLGLPICKSITEQIGGKIWVESEYGKGSVFRVWLPCLIQA